MMQLAEKTAGARERLDIFFTCCITTLSKNGYNRYDEIDFVVKKQ